MPLLQLDPMLPLLTDDGRKATAILVIDYSQEHDLLWVCFMDDTREIWALPNSRVRVGDNISLGRPAPCHS